MPHNPWCGRENAGKLQILQTAPVIP